MARASRIWRRLAAAACLALASVVAQADDYDVLRQRWQVRLTGGLQVEAVHDEARAGTSAEALRQWQRMDGSADRTRLWPDLGDWSRSATLYDNYRRLRLLALAYRRPDSALHANPELARSIVDGLDWLEARHYNPRVRYDDNWWHWQIGVPLVLGDLATLMYDDLDRVRLDRYLAAVDHFVPDPATHLMPDGRIRPGEETGANRLDKALAVALRGILGKSGRKIAAARDAVSQVLVDVDHDDGFYRDGSFIQHHDVAYAGGYGISVIADMAQLLYLFKDSPWAVRDPAVGHVYDWVQNSYRPFIFDGVMIDAVSGRKVSRRHEDDRTTARSVMGSLALLAQAAPEPLAGEIRGIVRGWILRDPGGGPGRAVWPAASYEESLLDAIARDDGIRPASEPAGVRFFPSQDRAVLRGPGFAWSLSMFSDRISAFESGNDENLRGWWTGMGMAQLYQGGPSPHADGYWPTVDLKRLPGTTTDHSGQGKPTPWAMFGNTRTWVGGATLDGQAAALGMEFSTAQVTGSHLAGKKSWFLFGDTVLALGVDISTPDRLDVETVVENRLLDAAHPRLLSIDGRAQPGATGWKAEFPAVHWAHVGAAGHDDGVGYVFPDATPLSAWREQRQGRWFDINQGAKGADDLEPITRSYLGLSLDHGVAPDRAAYAYVMLPGRSAAQTAAYAATQSIAVLANTSHVSAACDRASGAIGATAWAPLRKPLQLAGKDWLRTDGGLALVARHGAGTLALGVADPTQHADETVHVELGEAVTAVLETDPRIVVERTAPTLRLAIRFAGSAGATLHARFRQRSIPDGTALCPASAAQPALTSSS